MGGKQAVQATNGRIFRLVLPFVVATTTTVIVWFATRGSAVPVIEGNRVVDTGQTQLVTAVLAGLGALLVTAIIVGMMKRPKSRRSR
jgi:hypothetical protein